MSEPSQDQRQHHRRDERAESEREVEEIRRPHELFARGRSAGTATRMRTLLTFTCAAHPIPNRTTATSAPR